MSAPPAEAAFAAALGTLPGLGSASLVPALRREPPSAVWRRVRSGVDLGAYRPGDAQLELLEPAAPQPGEGTEGRASGRPRRGADPAMLAEVSARIEPAAVGSACRAAGIGVTWWGAPDYPSALVDDPAPPGVLFYRGSLEHLGQPAVAVIGTRRCSPDGAAIAYALGRDLVEAGVAVVSGLALGIDGAAHAGALATVAVARGSRPGLVGASTIGVAASGVDVPYPTRHRALWTNIARQGLILSESPPGQPAQAWRFPARNRVIAGLSRLVVVVESHRAGGSMHTVDAAIRRGVEVVAVPGPVRSPASEGTNGLLFDGCGPVRNADDVLTLLGLSPTPAASPAGPGGTDDGALDTVAARLLDAIAWGRPVTLDEVVEASGITPGPAALALHRLVERGHLDAGPGWWTRLRR
jgi:DNA processing protein